MRREQSRGRFQSKAERNLAHGLGEVRRISGALELSNRCAIRRVSCSGAHRMKICCVADPSRRSPQRACTARVDVTASRAIGGRGQRDGPRRGVTGHECVQNAERRAGAPLPSPSLPVSSVPRLASDLECPDEIRQRARTLAEQAEESGLTAGVHPAGFAAACLYKGGRNWGTG